MKTMPCLGETPEAIARCSGFTAWTEQEIEARERATGERIGRMGTIRQAIIADHKATGRSGGVLPCPACGKGQVQWSRARSNGHVHARCSTPDCASWME